MKNLALSVLVGGMLVLGGCGGGGGGGSDTYVPSNPTVENQQAQGIYTGTVDQAQDIGLAVKKNGQYWLIYSLPNSNSAAGFIQGTLSVNGNKFTSFDAKDFFISEGTSQNATVSGTVKTSTSLNGEVKYTGEDPIAFGTNYDKNLNSEYPSLSIVRGTYQGTVGILQGVEQATINIDTTGQLAGTGSSGCRIGGTVQPAGSEGNYYNVVFTFGGSPCYMENKTLTGLMVYDSKDKILRAAATLSDRSNGVLFVGYPSR